MHIGSLKIWDAPIHYHGSIWMPWDDGMERSSINGFPKGFGMGFRKVSDGRNFVISSLVFFFST